MLVFNIYVLCEAKNRLCVRFIALQAICYVSVVSGALPVQPHSQVVIAGQKVVLHCRTSLNSASVAWFHVPSGSSTAKIIYSPRHPLPANGVFSIDTATNPGRADLVIYPVGLPQAGLYVCRDNDGFSTVSAKAEVVVLNDTKMSCDVGWTDLVYGDRGPTEREAVIFECVLTFAGNLAPQTSRTTSTSVLASNMTTSVTVYDNSSVNTVTLHMLISVAGFDVPSYNLSVAFHDPSIIASSGSNVEISRMCRCSAPATVRDRTSESFLVENSPRESAYVKSHEQRTCFDKFLPAMLRVKTEAFSGLFVASADLQLQRNEWLFGEFDPGNVLLYLLRINTLRLNIEVDTLINGKDFNVVSTAFIVALLIVVVFCLLICRLQTFRRVTDLLSIKDVDYNESDLVFHHKCLTDKWSTNRLPPLLMTAMRTVEVNR